MPKTVCDVLIITQSCSRPPLIGDGGLAFGGQRDDSSYSGNLVSRKPSRQ